MTTQSDKIKQFAKEIKEAYSYDHIHKLEFGPNEDIYKLCDMLIEMNDVLEYCKSMFISPRAITHDELIDSCNHANEKICNTLSKLDEMLE